MTNPLAHRFVFVRSGKKWLRIDLDEVSYLESQGDYIQWMGLPNADKKTPCLLLAQGQMDRLFERLSPYGFVRIHRRFILNLQHLLSFDGEIAQLPHGALPVARGRRTRLQERMDELLFRQDHQPIHFPLPQQTIQARREMSG